MSFYNCDAYINNTRREWVAHFIRYCVYLSTARRRQSSTGREIFPWVTENIPLTFSKKEKHPPKCLCVAITMALLICDLWIWKSFLPATLIWNLTKDAMIYVWNNTILKDCSRNPSRREWYMDITKARVAEVGETEVTIIWEADSVHPWDCWKATEQG